jgi:hypothetical protein
VNHVVRLQTDLVVAHAEIKAKADAIQEFRNHLAGSKFAGVDADDTRKDWIATSDVWFADPTARITAATSTRPRRLPGGYSPAAADLR